jgi:hypothetical protein
MTVRRAPRCTSPFDARLREAVGAYLLGALEPAEADEVAAHLSDCESCRAEYGELADMVPLMAMVSEREAVQGPVRPEPAVLGRVLARSRSRVTGSGPGRGARPRRARFALAAACVVLAGTGSAVGMRMSTHATSTTAWSSSVVVTPYGHTSADISAMADVTPASWGSKIDLQMDGLPKGYKCSMIVVGTDGSRDSGGTWNVWAGGSITIPTTSSIPPEHIAAIEVDLPDGTVLLTVPHP